MKFPFYVLKKWLEHSLGFLSTCNWWKKIQITKTKGNDLKSKLRDDCLWHLHYDFATCYLTHDWADRNNNNNNRDFSVKRTSRPVKVVTRLQCRATFWPTANWSSAGFNTLVNVEVHRPNCSAFDLCLTFASNNFDSIWKPLLKAFPECVWYYLNCTIYHLNRSSAVLTNWITNWAPSVKRPRTSRTD